MIFAMFLQNKQKNNTELGEGGLILEHDCAYNKTRTWKTIKMVKKKAVKSF